MRPYSDNEDIEGGSTSSATTTSPHKRAATANIASSRQHHLSVHTNNIQRPHSPIGSESPSELHGLNNGGGGSYVMTPGGSRHIQVGKSSKYTSEDEWDEEDDR